MKRPFARTPLVHGCRETRDTGPRLSPFLVPVALVFIGCSGPAAAATATGPTVDVIPVSAAVRFLRSNSAISNPSSVVSIGPDGVLLVDTGIADATPALVAKIQELSEGRAPTFVVNTHFHADHTGGNTAFAAATVISHPLLRAHLQEQGLLGVPVPATALPDLTTDAALTLRFNGEAVRVVALAHGHTHGDLAVFFEGSNALATGDYYFYNTFPIIDVANGGSPDGYLANIATLLALANDSTSVLPGHSTLAPAAATISTRAEYAAWYRTIADAIGYVRQAKAEGTTLAAIQADAALSSLDRLTPLFYTKEKWLAVLYDGLPGG